MTDNAARAFFIDSSRPDVLEMLRRTDAGVIIFGAGTMGRGVLAAARAHSVSVRAFCDNNPALVGAMLDGVPVLSAESARVHHPAAFYFIAVPRFYSIAPDLVRLGLRGRCLTLDILRGSAIELPGYIAATVEGTAFEQRGWEPDGEGVFLSVATLVATDHCTLRCRHCSHRIPHIPNPRHRDMKEALGDIDRLLAFVDGIHTVSLSSGDSMTHPRIAELARGLLARPKVETVSIWTNAILPFLPGMWEGLGGKLSFHVTDYGHPRQDIAAFAAGTAAAGITTYVSKREWTEIRIGEERAEPAAARKNFQICQMSMCVTVNGDRLYRCTMIPNAVREGRIPDDGDNYVDLAALCRNGDVETARNAVRRFLFAKESMDACAYCSGGRPGKTGKIKTAEQLP